MITEASYPAELRPDQALAAMRIGFLVRRVEHESAEVWTAPLLKSPDVDSTFQEIDYELLALSHRFNDFESNKLSELRHNVSAWFRAAFHVRADWMLAKPPLGRDVMRQQIEKDPAVQGLQKLQRSRLDDLRRILLNVIGNDQRISAWFEIGDHLGHTIFRLIRGELSIPLSPLVCAELCSGIRKLPPHLQARVKPFFPDPNREGYDLAAELLETYYGLSGLILRLSPMVIPVWNGSTISFQGKSHSIKVQRNSVIVPILSEFQSQGWPLRITTSNDIDDVKQALFKFNKSRVVRLSQSGDQIRWHDPDELTQS